MITNPYLQQFLSVIKNKPFALITNSELKQVTMLSISTKEDRNHRRYDLSDLSYFPNLKQLTIENSIITVSDIEVLSHLNGLVSIHFQTCMFDREEDLQKINFLNQLSFYNCYLSNYQFFENYHDLTCFSMVAPYGTVEFDVSYLHQNKKMKQLILEQCFLKNSSLIRNFKELEVLSLLSTKLDSFLFLLQLPNLHSLYIDEKGAHLLSQKEDMKHVLIKTNLNHLLVDDYEE